MTNESIDARIKPKERIRFSHDNPLAEVVAVKYFHQNGLTGKDIIVPGSEKTLLEYFGPEAYYPK